MRRILFRALSAVLLLSTAAAWSQSDRATITGTVKDPSGAVIRGAEVQVTDTDTNEVRSVRTNGEGYYRAADLPVGHYRVHITAAGFSSEDRSGLTLLISQQIEINATLQPGQAETVVVSGHTPVLQTEDAVVSTNLTAEEQTELPLNVQGSRNLSNFMFAYVPGVEGSDYSSHIDGSMALSKEVLIDGISAVSQLGGYISESQPPMEAVQESEADTTGFDADSSRTGGGVFKYEMKSGTNQWHGSLFGFLHTPGLDAISATNKLHAIESPANAPYYLHKSDSLSDWGGSFGGHIVRDKLFFFGAFERYMQAWWSPGPLSRTVPTDAMMGLNSDGSVAQYADLSPMLSTNTPVLTYGGAPAVDDCGNPIYKGAIVDPATATNGSFGCVFVNNQIPTSRISTTTAKILQLYHKYYQPQSTLPVNDPGPAYQPDPWFHNTQSSIKVDYNFTPSNRLSGIFWWDYYPRINADQGGAWSVSAQYGGPLANSYWHNTTAPGLHLMDTWTVNQHLVNTAYGAFNRFRNPSIATSQPGHWDSQLGLLNGAGNFPLMYFDSGMYFGGADYQNGWDFSPIGSQYNDFYAANTFIYGDEAVLTHGRNNFKFGVEFRAMQFNYHTDDGTFMGGYPIIFDPTNTAPAWYDFNAYDLIGNSFASFLLGDVYNAENNNPDNEYGRRKSFAAFVQDDMKVSQRLTVSLSLRWDYNNPFKEKYGHWSSFELQDKNPVTGLQGAYEYLTNSSQSFEKYEDYTIFSPHVGAAFQVNNKTVLRGNAAVFFTPLNMNQWGGVPYQQSGDVGFHPTTQESNFNWDAGYHPTTTQVKTPDYTQSDVVSIDPHSLTPGNTQQYNIGVQRELGRETRVDVNWVQNHSYHLQSGIFQTNQPYFQDYVNYVMNGTYPASYNGYYNGVGPGWEGITPYPQAEAGYGPLLSVGVPKGNASYKALQLTFTRRGNHGFSYMGSYVWSRARGDVDSDFQELWGTGSLQNIYDLQDEKKDIEDFDQTHVVKGFVIYYLPFGRGKMLLASSNWLLNALVGGWSLNGDFHYASGTPIQVHSTNYYEGFSAVYVNLVPGCTLTTGTRSLNMQYLNPACFQNPVAGGPGVAPQLGNGGNFQEGVRNPGLATEDLGIHKGFAVGPDGRYNLTLRLEFFNVFNRDQLAGPNTNLGDAADFGKIQDYSSFGPRVGQLGARFSF